MIVDDSLIPLLAKVAPDLETVRTFIVTGSGDAGALAEATDAQILGYEELLAAEAPGFAWPDVDERSAAAMCYTSGTTGNPKGVVYSHRSTWLHSFAVTSASSLGVSESDRILPIVPMFHANAWGLPYAGWLVGADFLMPGRFLQPEPLMKFIEQERPTFSGAVPTIWADILRYGEDHEIDLSSVRMVVCGGSAVPRTLMEAFDQRYGVRIIQGWGMTETSPLAAVSHPPDGVECGSDEDLDWRSRTGRVVAGVELRIVDEAGKTLPWDDEAVGEIEVRGRGSPRRTTWTRRPRSSTTAGCAPATSAGSTRTGSSRSPTGPRTSSSPVASGSRRSSSKGCSWPTPTSSKRASWACPTRSGASGRSRAWC